MNHYFPSLESTLLGFGLSRPQIDAAIGEAIADARRRAAIFDARDPAAPPAETQAEAVAESVAASWDRAFNVTTPNES